MRETRTYIVLVLLSLGGIFAAKPQSTESEEDPATEETVEYLCELANKISNCLENPSTDNGTVLFRCLYEYYNELHGIYWMMRDKVKREKASRFLQEIINFGLPIHLVTTIDFNESKNKFMWNDIIVQELNVLIKDTKTLWVNCKNLM